MGKLVGGAQMHQLMEIEHLLKLERTIFGEQNLEKYIWRTILQNNIWSTNAPINGD